MPFNAGNVGWAAGPIGGIIGGLVGSDAKPSPPYSQPTEGFGNTTRLPGGLTTSGPYGNPFGQTYPQQFAGSVGVWGGARDLERSLATRGVGIDLTQQAYQQQDMPGGLQSALSGYAAQNPYLASMMSNYMPQVQSQALMQGEVYRDQLRQLMEKEYILGGGLYGGQLAAKTQAKQIQAQKDLMKKRLIQSVIQGVGKGLGDQYGVGSTSSGLAGEV